MKMCAPVMVQRKATGNLKIDLISRKDVTALGRMQLRWILYTLVKDHEQGTL